eukprot:TRINITY_DN8941_c0_g1_i1.p1 TRINITY_DN8941_c0_g1~~TRINITY_DN8941_c0_g1_i1.p1  ORF type:complete len:353 (+),score=37.11 TRINITY_DN8941_c0_g1_i1:62-1060(+)
MNRTSQWLDSNIETPLLNKVAGSRRGLIVRIVLIILLVVVFLIGYTVGMVVHRKTPPPCPAGLSAPQQAWLSLSQKVMTQGSQTYLATPPGGWFWPATSNSIYNPFPANNEGVIMMPASFQNAIVRAMANGTLVDGSGSGRFSRPRLHFVFHNGPSGTTTQLILDALEAANNIKATFFVLGSHVEQFSTEVLAMYEAGHHIGSRGYNHIDMTSASYATILSDVMQAEGALTQLIPFNTSSPKLFNPPYGFLSPNSLQVASDREYTTVVGGLDSFDTDHMTDPDQIVQWVVAKVPPTGGLLLFHDLEVAANVIEPLVARLKDQYDFVNSIFDV